MSPALENRFPGKYLAAHPVAQSKMVGSCGGRCRAHRHFDSARSPWAEFRRPEGSILCRTHTPRRDVARSFWRWLARRSAARPTRGSRQLSAMDHVPRRVDLLPVFSPCPRGSQRLFGAHPLCLSQCPDGAHARLATIVAASRGTRLRKRWEIYLSGVVARTGIVPDRGGTISTRRPPAPGLSGICRRPDSVAV